MWISAREGLGGNEDRAWTETLEVSCHGHLGDKLAEST